MCDIVAHQRRLQSSAEHMRQRWSILTFLAMSRGFRMATTVVIHGLMVWELGGGNEDILRAFLRKSLKFQSIESVAYMLHAKRAQSAKKKKIVLICYNYVSSLNIFIPTYKFRVKFNVHRATWSAQQYKLTEKSFFFKAKTKQKASVSLHLRISTCSSVCTSYSKRLRPMGDIRTSIFN
jgi:hypothetical protein